MPYSKIVVLSFIVSLSSLPIWADPDLPAVTHYHDVDMYGIYKVPDNLPKEDHHDKHEERAQAAQQPIYVVIPAPVATTPIPGAFSNDDEAKHSATAVEDEAHRLHLMLVNKLSHSEITTEFFNEENRYLSDIEHREQVDADTNDGYLTVAQEKALLKRLQGIEAEIDQNFSNQS